MKSHGMILGIIVFCGAIGGSLGPLVIGSLYDVLGNYQVSFLLLLGLAAVGMIAILVSGKGKIEISQIGE